MKIQNELDAEILKHKAEGKANKEVAPLVNLSEAAVKKRLWKMRKFFNCRNTMELLTKLTLKAAL
jgi:DNA-binding NarL/FixJ family response regulator